LSFSPKALYRVLRHCYTRYVATILLVFLFLFFSVCTATSLRKIINSKDNWQKTITWGFLFGFFVWEDVIFISLYFLGAISFSLFLHDLRILLVAYLAYWVVRGIGETFYYMSLQFHESKDLPHSDHWREDLMKRMFGDISYQKSYILIQVLVQIVTATAAVFLIFLLINWVNIPRWF